MDLRELWEWLLDGPFWLLLAVIPMVGYLALLSDIYRSPPLDRLRQTSQERGGEPPGRD